MVGIRFRVTLWRRAVCCGAVRCGVAQRRVTQRVFVSTTHSPLVVLEVMAGGTRVATSRRHLHGGEGQLAKATRSRTWVLRVLADLMG